jgi:hypothetical protein
LGLRELLAAQKLDGLFDFRLKPIECHSVNPKQILLPNGVGRGRSCSLKRHPSTSLRV